MMIRLTNTDIWNRASESNLDTGAKIRILIRTNTSKEECSETLYQKPLNLLIKLFPDLFSCLQRKM